MVPARDTPTYKYGTWLVQGSEAIAASHTCAAMHKNAFVTKNVGKSPSECTYVVQ